MKQSLLEKRKQKLDKFINSNFLANYINAVLRGLVMFLVAITLYFIINGFFNISTVNTFVIVFAISILVSVIFSRYLAKIKFGEIIQKKYIRFLSKLMGDSNEFGEKKRI